MSQSQAGSLLQHFSENEEHYSARMFTCGLVNNIGIGVLVAYTSQLASEKNQNYNFAMFCVFLQTVPIIAVFLNAQFLIQINHEIRVLGTCIVFLLSYMTLAGSIVYDSLPLALLSCMVHQFAKSIGEATVMGYMKGVPQELVVTFCSGMGSSSFFAFFSQLFFMEFGLELSQYFLVMGLLILPFYSCFMWIERNRLKFKQFHNCFVLNTKNPDLGKRVYSQELEVEVIQAEPNAVFKPERGSMGSSADSDHYAYNSESPLPSEERRYRKFLKEQVSASKLQQRRIDQNEDSEVESIMGHPKNATESKTLARSVVLRGKLDNGLAGYNSPGLRMNGFKHNEYGISPYQKPQPSSFQAQHQKKQTTNNSQLSADNEQDQDNLGPKSKQSLSFDNLSLQEDQEVDRHEYAQGHLGDSLPVPNDQGRKSSFAYHNWDTIHQEQRFDLSLQVGPYRPQRNMGLSLPVKRKTRFFRHQTIIAQDPSHFKYEAKDNRRIQLVAVSRVFEKTGSFIFNLGLVNCLESIIINLILVVYSYRAEESLLDANQQIQRLPFLEQYQYTILIFAYYMGSFVSLSSIQSYTLMYPWLPTVFQAGNIITGVLNLHYEWVTSYNVVFVWTVWVGIHAGTSYTNFLFLANTKTNLDCDMRLSYYERELVVNLLLIANDFGQLFAQVVCFAIMMYKYPELLFNPPG